MTLWVTLLLACVLAYAAKLAGHVVPPSWLDHPRATRISALLPVALLAALVAALVLRAPFLVVVLVGAAVAAGLRALT